MVEKLLSVTRVPQETQLCDRDMHELLRKVFKTLCHTKKLGVMFPSCTSLNSSRSVHHGAPMASWGLQNGSLSMTISKSLH